MNAPFFSISTYMRAVQNSAGIYMRLVGDAPADDGSGFGGYTNPFDIRAQAKTETFLSRGKEN